MQKKHPKLYNHRERINYLSNSVTLVILACTNYLKIWNIPYLKEKPFFSTRIDLPVDSGFITSLDSTRKDLAFPKLITVGTSNGIVYIYDIIAWFEEVEEQVEEEQVKKDQEQQQEQQQGEITLTLKEEINLKSKKHHQLKTSFNQIKF